jgi:hypothetical protein
MNSSEEIHTDPQQIRKQYCISQTEWTPSLKNSIKTFNTLEQIKHLSQMYEDSPNIKF